MGLFDKFKTLLPIFLIISIYFAGIFIFTDSAMGITESQKKQVKEKIKSNNLKRKQAREKINEIKHKEKIEINKLYESQDKLEETRDDIKYTEKKLSSAKNRLGILQKQLNSITKEHEKSVQQVSVRIRQIYKGERISILHLIFAAQDINTFLDRVYYQRRLAVFDKDLLIDLRLKTHQLINAKEQAENQRNTVLATLDEMNQKKKQIATSIDVSEYLINKLKTDRFTYEQAERELANQSNRMEAMLKQTLQKNNIKIKISTGFSKPVAGMITSPFGWRRHPIFGSRSFHTGVDIAGPNRTAIHSSNSGNVVFTGWYGGYGKVVIISHGNYKGTGTSTLYAHLSATSVSAGQSVTKGQVIGYEGTTGYSTGPHLHFEVRLNGSPTNPLNYIH